MNKRGVETRKLIKNKACVLFEEKGFKEVTMKDICESTGLSRGGLYCHYESTEKIFLEIVSSFLTSQENELEEKMKSNVSAVQILDHIFEKYRFEMLDAKKSLSLAIYEYFSSKKLESDENLLSRQYAASFHSFHSLIQYGISRGEFKDVNIKAIFDLLIFSYQGVRMYSRLMMMEEDIPERMIAQIKSMILPENREASK